MARLPARDPIKIGDYIFYFELDTGGAPPFDFNVWIKKVNDKKFGARRTWNGVIPHERHIQNFCKKFATDEEYRKKYL